MCFPMEKAVEKTWEFEGLQCIITRADLPNKDRWSQHRCGYVRIPAGHPWNGMDYNDIPAEAHGGLTFAEVEHCEHEDGIGYWIGFDCIHSGDSRFPCVYEFPPNTNPLLMDTEGHYWELNEVQAETEQLARQVKGAEPCGNAGSTKESSEVWGLSSPAISRPACNLPSASKRTPCPACGR